MGVADFVVQFKMRNQLDLRRGSLFILIEGGLFMHSTRRDGWIKYYIHMRCF